MIMKIIVRKNKLTLPKKEKRQLKTGDVIGIIVINVQPSHVCGSYILVTISKVTLVSTERVQGRRSLIVVSLLQYQCCVITSLHIKIAKGIKIDR